MPRRGQIRGASGAPHEQSSVDLVFRLSIPISLKEAGLWWTENSQAAADCGIKLSYRAARLSKKGPGWFTLTAQGTGGAEFLEEVLASLLNWRPDFDIDAVQIPELGNIFPTQAVFDALGNVKEMMVLPDPGVVLVDTSSLQVVVAGHSPEILILEQPRLPGGVTPEPEVPSSLTLTAASDVVSGQQREPSRRSRAPTPSPSRGVRAQSPARVQRSRSPVQGAASSSSGLVLSAGVTATISRTQKPQNTRIELPSAGAPSELPPFFSASQKMARTVAVAHNLSVSLGIERVPREGRVPLPNEGIRVAFCTTALRRPTVASALIMNMSLTWAYRNNVSWFLADFNEDDQLFGTLMQYIPDAVRSDHLRIFRSRDLPHWHASVAKNTAHMQPGPEFDVLVNVDGDNLLTMEFVAACLVMSERIRRGEVNLCQFASTAESGTYGRIMMSRTMYHKIGGYDETFLPSGCQDTDIIKRVLLLEGQCLLVSHPQQVGCSLPNKPESAAWRDQVREKVVNVAPQYRTLKWGNMDSQNRTRMYELLAEGRVQRNIGKSIGVACTYLRLEGPAAGVTAAKTPESDPDVPDYGEAVDEPIRVIPSFFVSTFGVAKLAAACDNNNAAANHLYELWEPTRNRAPRPVPGEAIANALTTCNLPRPDVVLDARVFLDRRRGDETNAHIGHSHLILRSVIQHSAFEGYWQDVLRQIELQSRRFRDDSMPGGVTPAPVHVTVFCRAGEKRSVAVAWLTQQVLLRKGWIETRPVEHLCRRFWRRKTCAGLQGCMQCNINSAAHATIVDEVMSRSGQL